LQLQQQIHERKSSSNNNNILASFTQKQQQKQTLNEREMHWASCFSFPSSGTRLYWTIFDQMSVKIGKPKIAKIMQANRYGRK